MWALKHYDGLLYAGVTCTAESGGSSADLSAHVYTYDGSSWSSALVDVPLGGPKGSITGSCFRAWHCRFNPWLDMEGTEAQADPPTTIPIGTGFGWGYPQPILADIEIDDDGSLLLGIADRFGHQYGTINNDVSGNLTGYGVTGGDFIRVCNTGTVVSPVYAIEGSAGCADNFTDPISSNGMEFYDDNATDSNDAHEEIHVGGLALLPGGGRVAEAVFDATPFGVPDIVTDSGGIHWLSNTTGSKSQGLTLFRGTNPAGLFGKGAGIGDLEYLCNPAPIELGNRVWCDAPMAGDTANGIQDPPGGSAPDLSLAGVTVGLSCNGGTITASTVTAAGGLYLFNDSNVTGGIPPRATCTVSIDTTLPANVTALAGCDNPVPADVGDSTDPGQDLRDSDGTDPGMTGTVSATVTLGSAGANDHSLDFGFSAVAPTAPMLVANKTDTVVVDGDGDGMLDAGDTLRYTVIVSNSGTADATAVTFSSSVGANTTLVAGSVTTSQGTVTTGNTAGDAAVAVDLGTVTMGGGLTTVTYDVTLDAPVPIGVTEVSCQGSVDATNHPPLSTDDPDDPTSSADPTETPVDAGPEISATKVDSLFVDGDFDGRVDAGDTVRYTVVVINSGDQDAASVVLTSSVDANTSLVVGSVTTSQGTVTTGNTAGDTNVAVDLGTVLNSGGSVTLTYDVTVDSPIPAGVTQISCQATVSGGNVPSTPTDDPDDPTAGDPTDTPLDLGLDFGDAPDSYTTTASPRHVLDAAAGIYLGDCVDSEASGQPATTFGDPADGDDLGAPQATLGTCAGGDDEDGVSFDTMIVACSSANQLTVTSAGMGRLDGWIDFNADGDFADAGEQIFTNQPLTGSDALPFDAPCSTGSGTTYSRFRVSSAGGLDSTGSAADGEVEDYLVTTKGLDFGDAPDSYGTSQATSGPSHVVDAATPLFLGACVDTEADGQPAAAGDPATGDDLGSGISVLGSCVGSDDEDGVTFDDMAVACGTSNLTVTASNAGLLDAWIDFGGDGAFAEAGDQILSLQPVSAGANSVTYTVPCGTSTQEVTYARFRLSSTGGLTPGGPAMDGEVEDYEIPTKGLDFGDAPEIQGYPTLLASDGARHAVLPVANPTLGASTDTEADGQPSPDHDGDDLSGVDDEDGVALPGALLAGGPGMDVTMSAGATGGFVSAWVDWNGDGDWLDAGEQILSDLTLAPNDNDVISIAAPVDAFIGTVCARFRISSASGLNSTGLAPDGEVEDYSVEILDEDPSIGIGKALLGVERLDVNQHLVTLAITVDNLGNVELSAIQVVARLADAFAGAEGFSVEAVETPNFTVNPEFDGDSDANLLVGSDTLGANGTGTIILQVILNPGADAGPYECSSVAQGVSPGGVVVGDISQDGGDSDPDDDGDPTNNEDPTLVVLSVPPVDIPTVGQLGLLALATALATLGLAALRQRGRNAFSQ